MDDEREFARAPRVTFDVDASLDLARARERSSDEDEFDAIASRVEARVALAVETVLRRAAAADARRGDGRRASGVFARAVRDVDVDVNAWDRVVETSVEKEGAEERLRAMAWTLAATRDELARERARASALREECERARLASVATVEDRNGSALELAASVAELEAEKAEAMRERARLTEMRYELERKMEEVSREARDVRSIKERIERENEITHEKMRANQLRLLESEMERKALLGRLRSADDETLVANLRQNLAEERARRRELETLTTELHRALDSSAELVESYQQKLESLGRLGAAASVPLDALEPDDEAKKSFDRHTAQAIEAHLIWRRRQARREPGDAESDWRKSEAALDDRLARRDGDVVAYWAYLDSLAHLCVLGDVSALDTVSHRAIGEFIVRVSAARAAARAADPSSP